MKKHMYKRIFGSALLVGIGIFMPLQTQSIRQPTMEFALKKAITATASANWAGYAATGKGFTAISATWKIPVVQPSHTFGVDATWVGIGGVNNNDLIQSGTESETQNGTVQYDAWTEILPAVSKPLAITVHGGDSISVAINEQTPNHWQISFADNTTGQSTSKNITYASTHSSAEWIEEAPSDTNGPLPIDNFGKVSFNNATVMQNGKTITIAKAKAQAITLANDDGSVLAQPSVLSKAGNSFSVTRAAAKATTSRAQFGGFETWTHANHGIKKRRLYE